MLRIIIIYKFGKYYTENIIIYGYNDFLFIDIGILIECLWIFYY